jgi:hypothetical protein
MMLLKILFWIAIAIASPILIYYFGSKSKALKIALQVVLLVAIVFLSYSLYESIMDPIRFENKRNVRERAAVAELIKIRTAQTAFKKENGYYTDNFDTLIHFVKNDSITEIKRSGLIPDSIFLNADNVRAEAEKRAIELGILSVDTIRVATEDSLFKDYNVDKLGRIPFNKNKKIFKMDTTTVEAGGIDVQVFQAHVKYKTLFEGMNKSLTQNVIDRAIRNDNFPGLKVGSLVENNNNAGNWSKELEIKK